MQATAQGKSGQAGPKLRAYVSGRVVTPGGVRLPEASALNQTVNLAGGTRKLKGNVEFIAFQREGEVVRHNLSYKHNGPNTS